MEVINPRYAERDKMKTVVCANPTYCRQLEIRLDNMKKEFEEYMREVGKEINRLKKEVEKR